MFRLVVLVITLLVIGTTTYAQDVVELTVGEVYRYQPTSSGEQFFGTFAASAGDVVYLVSDYEGIVMGTISIDLRDSVGRSIGTKDDYMFEEYIIAEIPQDSTYTVVATIEEAEPINILVGRTTYLSEEPFEVTLTSDGFPFFFGVQLEDSGAYTIQMDRLGGDLGVDIQLIERREFFNETVLTLGGTGLMSAQGSVELSSSNDYVGIVSRALISSGSEANVTVSLTSTE